MSVFKNFKKVSSDGMLARVFLSFLATAGLFYVNIMPAIVDGLIEALGFTNQQAGAVGSANIYGAAAGALFIVFLVKKLDWQLASLFFLLALISIDLASMGVDNSGVLMAMRFGHGFFGGMLIGTVFSVIARTDHPDRTFGVLLFVQFGLGGFGVMFIPGLVPQFGTSILFLSLVAFSTVSLLMLPFLPVYAVEHDPDKKAVAQPILWGPLALSLAALFLFQAANMGLYAYIIGLGEHYGLERGFITTALGVSAWLGLAGAGLVVLLSNRFGYARSLALGISVTLVANWALLFSDIAWVFFAINALIGVSWAFTIPYLLGLASRFDKAGQMAAVGGFASKMGLASGPAVAAYLLGEDRYEVIIWAAVIFLFFCLIAAMLSARVIDRQ